MESSGVELDRHLFWSKGCKNVPKAETSLETERMEEMGRRERRRRRGGRVEGVKRIKAKVRGMG